MIKLRLGESLIINELEIINLNDIQCIIGLGIYNYSNTNTCNGCKIKELCGGIISLPLW